MVADLINPRIQSRLNQIKEALDTGNLVSLAWVFNYWRKHENLNGQAVIEYRALEDRYWRAVRLQSLFDDGQNA